MTIKPPSAMRFAVPAWLVLVLVPVLVLAALPLPSAANYRFDIVALAPAGLEPSVPPLAFDSFQWVDVPTINDNGVVAFRAAFHDDRLGRSITGIFVGQPGSMSGMPAAPVVRALATSNVRWLPGGVASFGRPAIGNSGVAWRALGAAGMPVKEDGLFRHDFATNTTTVIAQNTPSPNRERPNPFEAATFGDPALNNRAPVEDVAFTFENPALASAVIVDPLPGVQVAARNYAPVGPNGGFTGNPVINDRLTVAVNAADIGVAPRDGRHGTIVGTGTVDPALRPRPFLTPASPPEVRLYFSNTFGGSDPSINNRDQIAVIAEFDRRGPLVVVAAPDGAEPLAIADTRGSFVSFHGSPSINDVGNVAFAAMVKGGDSGIFLHAASAAPGTEPAAIVRTGDVLFGKQIQSLGFGDGSRALNNANELVFVAYFVDGSQAVVHAAPLAVAEPPLSWLFTGGLVVCVSTWRRRRAVEVTAKEFHGCHGRRVSRA